MGQLRMYLYVALAVVILGMVGTIALLYKDNQNKAEKIAELKITVQTIEISLEKIRSERKKDQSTILRISLQSREHEMIAQKVISELERAKKQRAAVLGRPTLVERMANRATAKVFGDLECVAGGLCDE